VEPRAFSVVSALVPEEPGRFAGVIDPEWTVLGKPNGGYLLAMLGRAAASEASATGHEHVIAATATYLRSPDPGDAVITAEVLRAGKSATQVRATLAKSDVPCIEALFTVATLDPDAAPYWSAGLPPMSTVPYQDCLLPPGGGPVAIANQVEVRLEPASAGWVSGQPTGQGELRGWLTLPHGENFSPLSLLFAVDAFPPATFDVVFTGWIPTLSMSVYVRALPAPGPVRILHKAQLIGDGRVDEVCLVWDSVGQLVAQGTQLAGIRFA
jgi:acyl-coenzyme A thioesterase PaaI-like protein